MIKDIKRDYLSHLEKYMAVYEIVKKFKEYKESHNDIFESKEMSQILFNNYIVCVGFSRLLVELLNKVGISSKDISLDVDTSYERGFTLEEKIAKFEGHRRVLVNLVDPKYNIDGFYMADPTWDNDLKQNYIRHFRYELNLHSL